MPTKNRGQQPNDQKLFAAKWHPIFTEAVDDYCYLLSRGYADTSILQIVGNRYKLNKRQRSAIGRIASSDQEVAQRQASSYDSSSLTGKTLDIDGFNILILLEGALSGAFVFKGRDGTYRDISSVHGSYKRVIQTESAILLIGNTLNALGVSAVKWYLDQPVSNSGRLKSRLLEIAEKHGFNWEVELVFNPDKELAQSEEIVVSSDGWILDHAGQWFNLGALLIEEKVLDANVIVV